jgi:hypothetical protein
VPGSQQLRKVGLMNEKAVAFVMAKVFFPHSFWKKHKNQKNPSFYSAFSSCHNRDTQIVLLK